MLRLSPDRFILVVTAALVLAAPLTAAPACVSQSLSAYLAGGFECEVDTALFRDFDFSSSSGVTSALEPEEITVSPLAEGGRVGLRFSGDFESMGLPNGPGPAEGLSSVQYRFFFEVSRPGWLFNDALVRLNDPFRFSPNPLKFGGVLSGKSIANDGATASVNDQDAGLEDIGVLFTARPTIVIDELLQLTGGASAASTVSPVGFVTLSSADNLFGYEVVIPEPSTWMLLLSGLGLLVCRRHLMHSE